MLFFPMISQIGSHVKRAVYGLSHPFGEKKSWESNQTLISHDFNNSSVYKILLYFFSPFFFFFEAATIITIMMMITSRIRSQMKMQRPRGCGQK